MDLIELLMQLEFIKNIKSDCIVLDFGTATTFDVVTKNGNYIMVV